MPRTNDIRDLRTLYLALPADYTPALYLPPGDTAIPRNARGQRPFARPAHTHHPHNHQSDHWLHFWTTRHRRPSHPAGATYLPLPSAADNFTRDAGVDCLFWWSAHAARRTRRTTASAFYATRIFARTWPTMLFSCRYSYLSERTYAHISCAQHTHATFLVYDYGTFTFHLR